MKILISNSWDLFHKGRQMSIVQGVILAGIIKTITEFPGSRDFVIQSVVGCVLIVSCVGVFSSLYHFLEEGVGYIEKEGKRLSTLLSIVLMGIILYFSCTYTLDVVFEGIGYKPGFYLNSLLLLGHTFDRYMHIKKKE
jgi:hypothetical protein